MQNSENTLPEETQELDVIEPQGDETQGDDPFDRIEDETVRDEAKKYRAIATRKDKKETKVEPTVQPTSNFVTKTDMAKIAVKEAKETASEEVKANWDELLNIPLAGYDNLDAKSIVSNMTDRLAIFKARPVVEKKVDPTVDLKTTQSLGTGTGVAPKDKPKDPPNFNLPRQPEDWYPKS